MKHSEDAMIIKWTRVRRTTGPFTDSWRIKIALESFFEQHVQDVWERNWMNLEMQTKLLSTHPPKTDRNDSEGASWTTQREWAVECSWGNCRAQYPKSLQSMINPWKKEEDSGMMSPVDQKILCWRREEIDWVDSEGVYEIVPMQECKTRKFDRDWEEENTRRRSKARFNELDPLLSCSLQCHLRKLWRCLSQSWCRWVGRTTGNHWSWDTTTSAEHISKAQARNSFTSDSPQKIVRNMAKTKLADWSRACMEPGSARRRLCVFVRRRWTQTHRQSSQIQIYSKKDMGTLGFGDSDVKSLLLLNRVFGVGTDQSGQYLDIEIDLTHTHHSSSVNQNALRTLKQWAHRERNYKTSWCQTEDGVRFWREKMQHDTDLLAWEFHTWPKTDWILLKQHNIWPREWASLANSTLSRWNVQRDVWWESPKRRWDLEDRNMLTRSQSSWTATLLAIPSRGRVRRVWWLRLVTTLWILDPRFGALSVGEVEFYAVVKGGQVGLALRSIYQDLGIPMKIKIQSDKFDVEFFDRSIGSRTAHETHWHAALLDTRTSSRWRPRYQDKCHGEELRRCWNEASLCFSTPTTLQFCRICILLIMDPTLHYKMKVRQPMMDLVTVLQSRSEHRDPGTETDSCQRWSWASRRMCKLSETSERWTSLGTSKDERIMTAMVRSKSNGKMQRENFVNTDWRRTWRELLEPTDARRWQREQTLFQDQAVVVHASNWMDRKQLADVLSQFCGSFRICSRVLH